MNKPPEGRVDASGLRAISWLEGYQEREYARLNLKLPTCDPKDLINSASSDEIKSPPVVGSKYDDPIVRQVLHEIALQIQDRIAPVLKPTRPPIIGMLPMSSPRAMCAFHKPTGEHVLIFHRGQFEFFDRAISALVHVCPIRKMFEQCTLEELSRSDAWRDGERYNQALPLLLQALLGAALDMRAYDVRIKPLFDFEGAELNQTEIERLLSSRIQECLTAFVVGHEYAHIVEKNMVRETGSFGAYGRLNEADTAVFLGNLMSETLADDVGIGLAHRRNGASGFGPEESYLGIMLFFLLTMLLEDFVSLLRDGHPQDRESSHTFTHPSLGVRWKQAGTAISKHDRCVSQLERGEALTMSFWAILANFSIQLAPLIDFFREKRLYECLAPEFMVG